jgi:hypothetical protein
LQRIATSVSQKKTKATQTTKREIAADIVFAAIIIIVKIATKNV